MGALVEHDFKLGFSVDEERLRKIHEIVERRVAKYPTPLSLRYKVSRGDSFSYETASVQDVVNEDNDDWRAITRLELFAVPSESYSFRLTFSHERVFLLISGDDRDAVFLLFSDLREYISKEVLVRRRLGGEAGRYISVAGAALVVLAFTSYVLYTLRTDPLLVSKAIANGDLTAKLNFLIEQMTKYPSAVRALPWMLATFFVVLLAGDRIVPAWNAVFPTNVFLFGKRKGRFENRQRVLGKIFWAVIVGLLVSAAGGIIVWYITKK